jgi:hypothetical protein
MANLETAICHKSRRKSPGGAMDSCHDDILLLNGWRVMRRGGWKICLHLG